ncbi:hypothetical protein RRG08_008789 [Elysia crispata]|uniref:Tubulin polyglutamylase complex subunit 1-like C-terminal domain-containing protein n=1 Tax=Elysia crispata TaxID=231223 RepID=A0AAE0Z9C5_9GAST|nr:hypothetical protein RRG08_008789 [Elysia crispata]
MTVIHPWFNPSSYRYINDCDPSLVQLIFIRIMESSYSLGPEGLYGALDRAMANKQGQGFYTQDQFVIEACETFLTKVKRSKS